MSVYILFGISAFCLRPVIAHQFPENFLRCNLKDTNLDQCLVRAIENALHIIGNTGIPSLNLPSIDPIGVSNIQIGADGSSAVNIVQQYKNISIFGLSDVKVEKAHYDQHKKILNFTAEHPVLSQEAKYNITGKVLILSVYGNGDSIITLKKPRITHVAYFKEYTKGDKRYFRVEDYSATYTIQGAHFVFENMFNGAEKTLSGIVSKLINENWQLIAEEVRGGVQKAYGQLCMATANRIFETVPIDEIFLGW
ncbi:unnamed protein product [Phaedon cochleariae]|uniref:Uncharacterized protein n=1 Tax=Phaedon cochleariae TaxID=80249 RepID=A0A9N9X5A8_PHACE|nr:unnamed protein product [Phaedon cochleariae]